MIHDLQRLPPFSPTFIFPILRSRYVGFFYFTTKQDPTTIYHPQHLRSPI